jgi:hypothetical protein
LRRDLEVVGRVVQVGERAAHVVGQSGGAGDGADATALDRLFLGEHADTLGAALPHVVVGQQVLEHVDALGEPIEERLDRLMEPHRQVLAQAADPQVAGEQAEAGDQLVDVEEQLALLQAVQQDGDGADFHPVRAEPDQVAGEPVQLGEEHADVGHPLRHLRLEAEQLLDGEDVAERVRLRPQVVHALDERDHLLPLLRLGGLLDAGVEIADGRQSGDDALAVELDDQT